MKHVLVVPNEVELERAMVALGLQSLPPEVEERVMAVIDDAVEESDDDFDVFQSMHEGRRLRRPTRDV